MEQKKKLTPEIIKEIEDISDRLHAICKEYQTATFLLVDKGEAYQMLMNGKHYDVLQALCSVFVDNEDFRKVIISFIDTLLKANEQIGDLVKQMKTNIEN